MMKSKRNGLKWTLEEEDNMCLMKKKYKNFSEIASTLERGENACRIRFYRVCFIKWLENIDNEDFVKELGMDEFEFKEMIEDFLQHSFKKLNEPVIKYVFHKLKKDGKYELFIDCIKKIDTKNEVKRINKFFGENELLNDIEKKDSTFIFNEWFKGINYKDLLSTHNLSIYELSTIIRHHLFGLNKKMKDKKFYEQIKKRIILDDFKLFKEEIPEFHSLKTYIETIEPLLEKYKDYKEIKPIKEIKELPTINEYVKEKIGEDYLLLCKKYGIEESQLDMILDEQLNDKNYEYNYKQKYYQGWFNNSSDKFVKTKLLEGMSLREIADIFGRKIQEVDNRRYKFIEDELKILVENTSPKRFYKK